MLLTHKVAVIYGAGGSIGGAIARGFAAEGARLFLSGRTQAKVDAVARSLTGVEVHTAEVDATNQQAVETYLREVAATTGTIDISVNVIGVGDVQKPLLDITLDEFLQPIVTASRTHFITTRAAVPYMPTGGVVLAFGGSGPQTEAGLGGFKVSLDAQEGLRRQWALELGARGIRVLTIKTGGIPESIADTFPQKQEIAGMIERLTLLKRAATLDDVGKVAAFLASDHARSITSTEINISAGAIVD